MNRLALSLALALALPALATAQDAPPAGLLDHVKAGQRWVFSTGAGAGSLDEVLYVLEVVPAEGKVVYMTATKITQEAATTTVGPGELQEWTWGSSPNRESTAVAPGISSERRKLEVPGAKLDVWVLKVGTAPNVMETSIAVKGDLEVFPAIVGTGVGAEVARRLVRVEQGPVLPRPPTPAQLVAHVRVGQTWTFRVGAPDAQVTIVRKITAVDPESGTVTYDERMTSAGGEPEVSEGTTWTPGELVPFVEGRDVKTEEKPLEVPGMKLACRVTSAGSGEQASSSWTAARDGRSMFPGAVKVTQGGATVNELIKVE